MYFTHIQGGKAFGEASADKLLSFVLEDVELMVSKLEHNDVLDVRLQLKDLPAVDVARFMRPTNDTADELLLELLDILHRRFFVLVVAGECPSLK